MGLRLLHLNLHGLFRSHDLELGRDADTGGQTLYVLELIRGLASRPEVEQVDLVTRLIQDRKVSTDYSQREERVGPGSRIIRLPFGPKRYLRKELLWPYLDELADQLVQFLQREESLPSWIHAHYADAGYVGSLVSRRLSIPLVFTGHSLGREKQRRLLAAGVDHEQIEQTYSISRRIEAEEMALAHSDLIITSTKQEAENQYSRYGRFSSDKAYVVPPGVDSTRFHPSTNSKEIDKVNQILGSFLRDPSLPPLLAISRAVRRKNIPALVEAYGRSSLLCKNFNLILVLGCRGDLRQLDKQQREVFQQIFDVVDRYNLYGKVAYPKQHKREQIPAIYRWAANKKGLFVNPALTEPFGLTLLEAAASGLPTVSTDDGGPRDILSRCQNGLLADVTDLDSLQDVLEQASSDSHQWRCWSENGVEAVSRHFSWDAHVCNYLALMQKRLKSIETPIRISSSPKQQNPFSEKLLFLELDSSLENLDLEGLDILRQSLQAETFNQKHSLGILTGRSIKAARHRYRELHLPEPNVWICRTGTEIYYGSEDQSDLLWESTIANQWSREAVEVALVDLKQHMSLQDPDQQSPYKISYLLKQTSESIVPLVAKRLRQRGLEAIPYLRCHWYLDVLPLRASRTEAIRHLVLRWNLPLKEVYVIASQQGDAELLKGLTTAVVPADHDPCLERFRSQNRVFFASRSQVKGVLDGLNNYKFFSNS